MQQLGEQGQQPGTLWLQAVLLAVQQAAFQRKPALRGAEGEPLPLPAGGLWGRREGALKIAGLGAESLQLPIGFPVGGKGAAWLELFALEELLHQGDGGGSLEQAVIPAGSDHHHVHVRQDDDILP